MLSIEARGMTDLPGRAALTAAPTRPSSPVRRQGREGMAGPDRESDAERDAEARDACIRAVTRDARTQLVRAHPVERTHEDVSLVRLDLLVEGGQPRRCRCWFDHRTKAVSLEG
jgi:hypothetical protein